MILDLGSKKLFVSQVYFQYFDNLGIDFSLLSIGIPLLVNFWSYLSTSFAE